MAEGHDWSDAVVLNLRKLWAEGHSTAEIGRRLGVSKNAIVGKAHRLHLPSRPSPVRKRYGNAPAQKRPRCARSKSTLPSLMETAPVAAPPRESSSLTEQGTPPPDLRLPARSISWSSDCRLCCWPIGEPGTPSFRYCDQPINGRGSYCAAHAHVAYARRQPRALDEMARDVEWGRADRDRR
jgi:GcrA cell cycle regulator